MKFDRRDVLAGGAALAVVGCGAPAPLTKPAQKATVSTALAELEAEAGGRLGAFILDTGSGKMTGHRFDERFGMCSTFKLALAAAVLHRADKGLLKLETVLPYTKADLLPNSPVTTDNVGNGGMTIVALAEATQKTSDNAAANVIMRHLGGPSEVTRIFRSWGDKATRLDRYELEMNEVPSGEVRDTTSPQAFAQTMAKMLADDLLSPASRGRLIQWMVDTKTGAKRIRAGLPSGWVGGDKTGTYNTKVNDVAVFWPPASAPVIVTAYYESDGDFRETRSDDEAVLAEVGRIAAAQAIEWHKGVG